MRLAGFASLLLVGVPNVLTQVLGPEIGTSFPVLDPWRLSTWLGAALVFALAFWRATGTRDGRPRGAVVLLALQASAALTMFHITCTGYESTQLVIVAAELGLFFPLRFGMIGIGLMSAVQAWLGTYHWTLPGALMWAFTLTFPYELLALLTSHFAASQSRARDSLSRANAELRATRALLADSSRMAERARISRELHDLLGHHLTALHLQLEVATHLAEGEVRGPVSKAKSVAKVLLADLREAVSTLRKRETIPRLTIKLTNAPGFVADIRRRVDCRPSSVIKELQITHPVVQPIPKCRPFGSICCSASWPVGAFPKEGCTRRARPGDPPAALMTTRFATVRCHEIGHADCQPGPRASRSPANCCIPYATPAW